MSTAQSQPLLISLESKVHSGPLSSTSSTSSSSFSQNATTRAMRSSTIASSASNYPMSFSERSQFSPYPQRSSSRRGTVSGDTRRHSHNHSPPTPSMLLESLSSPHRSMMYHPNPPSSNSPSPSIAPSVLLPDNSPSMTSPSYYGLASSFGQSSGYDDFIPFHPQVSDSTHGAAIPRQSLPPFPITSTPPMHARERELEEEIKELQSRIRSMESMLSSTQNNSGGDHSLRSGQPRFNGTLFSYNTVLGAPPSDWDGRTRTRERIFCSLNRAGNALCAWHDSRRERRLYPPRMAPPRTLNCGCTYEQALFEESLARNGVGSYWPGDSVRMDPALRNALLALLEEKYNYRDGDFERNTDGTWKEGQDAVAWEEKSLRPLRRERS